MGALCGLRSYLKESTETAGDPEATTETDRVTCEAQPEAEETVNDLNVTSEHVQIKICLTEEKTVD